MTRHHNKYVSNQDIIMKCLNTYADVLHNMPIQWYVDRVYESVVRKVGVKIKREEVEATVCYFMRDKIDYCRHCYGTGKNR